MWTDPKTGPRLLMVHCTFYTNSALALLVQCRGSWCSAQSTALLVSAKENYDKYISKRAVIGFVSDVTIFATPQRFETYL